MDVVGKALGDFLGSGFNARNAFVKFAAEKVNDTFFDASKSNNKGSVNSNNGNVGCKKDCGLKVDGLVFAGCGPLKSQLYISPFLNPRIIGGIISVVDTPYGGKLGFHEAISKSSSKLAMGELEKENEFLENQVFKAISENSSLIAIGYEEVIKAIELNAVHTIILSWESGTGHQEDKRHDSGSKSLVNRYVVSLVSDDGKEDIDKHEIDHRFCRSYIEAEKNSKEMLLNWNKKKNDDNDGKKSPEEKNNLEKPKKVKTTIQKVRNYFEELCEDNNVNLRIVGVHSPITMQFAKGFSGCVGLLHFAVDNWDENDDTWISN